MVFVMREALMLAIWVNAWMTDEVVWAKGKVPARVAPPTAPEQEG
jgi:ceramide glucosyltransferase